MSKPTQTDTEIKSDNSFEDFLSESDFTDPMTLSSNLLDGYIIEFVEMSDSNEYAKAVAIVKRYNDLRTHIKEVMKCKNMTRHTVRRDKVIYSLEFTITEQMRVAVKEIPISTKLTYTRPNQVWRVKNCSRIDL